METIGKMLLIEAAHVAASRHLDEGIQRHVKSRN